MRCELYRTALSARVDGEETGIDPASVEDHLVRCAPCRAFVGRLGDLNRVVRVREAEPVPDLTGRILAASRPAPPRSGDWIRYALLTIGLTMAVLSLPSLLAPLTDGDAHLARHSSTWSLALGIAILVVAWQPSRARGLLPFALVAAVVTVVAAAVDVSAGAAAAADESTHLVEVLAVVLLWMEARRASNSVDLPLLSAPGWHRSSRAEPPVTA